MKVKLVFSDERERVVVMEVSAIPRVGEQIVVGGHEAADVVKVVCTPSDPEFEAVVAVKKIVM